MSIPLFAGSNQIQDVYFGENPINEIYKGSDLVWRRGDVPPDPMDDRYLRGIAFGGSSSSSVITLNFSEPDPVPAGNLFVAMVVMNGNSRVPSISGFTLVASWLVDTSSQATYVFAKESDGVENGFSINVSGSGVYNMGRAVWAFEGFSSVTPTYIHEEEQPSGSMHTFDAPPVSTRGVLINVVNRVAPVTLWSEGEEIAAVGRISAARQIMPGAEAETAAAPSNQVSRKVQLVFPLE